MEAFFFFFLSLQHPARCINVGYVLPPIPKDLFLKRKVIMEDTFNELTA